MNKLKEYNYVIWDWNGTMLDDVELCVDVGNNLFRKKNIPLMTVDKYKSIFTIPVKDYYVAAGFDFSKESFEVVGKEWMDEYEERKYEASLSNGLIKVMEKFEDMGIKQSVVSAYKQDNLTIMVENFKLDKYLDHIIGLDNIYAAGKIHLAQGLIDKVGNGNGNFLMIGDTVHDFEVADNIGADCILIASGHQSKEILMKTGVKTYDSLIDFYDNELRG